jgi:hypothetical protein
MACEKHASWHIVIAQFKKWYNEKTHSVRGSKTVHERSKGH